MSSLDADPLAVVGGLIARKRYGKAVRLLENQLRGHPDNPRLQLALADALVLDGRNDRAVLLLSKVADTFAGEGFTAKAIAVLKKLQRIDPDCGDVEARLADLVQTRARPHGASIPAEFQIVGRVKRALAEADRREREGGAAAEVEADVEAVSSGAAAASGVAEGPAADAPVSLEGAPTLGTRPVAAAPPAAEPPVEPPAALSDDVILFDIDDQAPAPDLATTPLFEGFSRDELVEVIRGLRAVGFTPGDIIVSQGEPGDSLFIVTSGTVKAFVRGDDGRAVKVREMGEGSFFGEISFLSGRPRTATITAAGACELLELDRQTMLVIAASHPRVEDVLLDFYYQRGGDAVDAPPTSGDGESSAG